MLECRRTPAAETAISYVDPASVRKLTRICRFPETTQRQDITTTRHDSRATQRDAGPDPASARLTRSSAVIPVRGGQVNDGVRLQATDRPGRCFCCSLCLGLECHPARHAGRQHLPSGRRGSRALHQRRQRRCRSDRCGQARQEDERTLPALRGTPRIRRSAAASTHVDRSHSAHGKCCLFVSAADRRLCAIFRPFVAWTTRTDLMLPPGGREYSRSRL